MECLKSKASYICLNLCLKFLLVGKKAVTSLHWCKYDKIINVHVVISVTYADLC